MELNYSPSSNLDWIGQNSRWLSHIKVRNILSKWASIHLHGKSLDLLHGLLQHQTLHLYIYVYHNISWYLVDLEKSKMATKHCGQNYFQTILTILGKFYYASLLNFVWWFMDVKYTPILILNWFWFWTELPKIQDSSHTLSLSPHYHSAGDLASLMPCCPPPIGPGGLWNGLRPSVRPSVCVSVRAHISDSFWWIFINFENLHSYQYGIMPNQFSEKFGKIQDGRQTPRNNGFPDILRSNSLQITTKFCMLVYGCQIQPKFDFGPIRTKFKMAARHQTCGYCMKNGFLTFSQWFHHRLLSNFI
jgi:hypothetical protein